MIVRGREVASHQAHTLEIAGSIPAPATKPLFSLAEARELPLEILRRARSIATRENASALKRQASRDLLTFAGDVMGLSHVVVDQEDREFASALVAPFFDPEAPRRNLWLRPRKTRKTLYGSMLLPVWLHSQDELPGFYTRDPETGEKVPRPLHGPDLRILICSETMKLAGQVTQTHRAFRDLPGFRQVYGPLKHEPLRYGSGYNLSTRRQKTLKDASVSVEGVDSESTGGRADVIIFDDLVTMASTRNADRLEKTHLKVLELLPFLEDWGIVWMYGTPYHLLDEYHRIEKRERERRAEGKAPRYHCVRERPFKKPVPRDDKGFIIPKDIKLYNFPVTLSPAALEDIYAEQDDEVMSSQYFMQVLAGRFEIFTSSMFRFIESKRIRSNIRRYLLTDTATTEDEDNCRSVIITVDVEAGGRRIVRDYQAGYWAPSEFLDRLFEVARDWGPCAATFERIGLNNVFRGWITERMTSGSVKFDLLEIDDRQQKTKDERIRSLQPFLRNANMVFDIDLLKRHPDFESDFLDEFLLYRQTALNDVPDALSDAFATYTPKGSPQSVKIFYLAAPRDWESLGGVEEFREAPIHEAGFNDGYR